MAKKLISLDDAQPLGSRLPADVRADLNNTYVRPTDAAITDKLPKADAASMYATKGEALGILGDDRARAIGIGSSTMQLLGPDLQDMFTRYGVTYSRTHTSVGGWKLSFQGAAVGTRPLVAEAFTIPASGAVTIVPTNMSEDGNHAATLSIPGSFLGITGTLATAASSPDWTFTRSGSGTATPVPAGTPFIPTTPVSHQRAIALLNPGKNTLGSWPVLSDWTIERIIGMTERMVEYFGGADGRVLVIGHFVDTNKPADSIYRPFTTKFNDHFRERLGKRFFDLSAYLTGTQVWTDTGITPTQADLDQQAIGNKPPSLSNDDQHLNQTADLAVTAQIEARLLELGWIKTAAPGPFETILAADNFDRADGALGSTSTGSFAWAPVSGATAMPTIVGGKVKNLETVVRRAIIDATPTNYESSAVIAGKGSTPAASEMAVLARCTSTSSYYYLTPRFDPTNAGIALYKNVSGTVTRIGGTTSVVPAAGQRLSLRVNGSTLTAYLDGVAVIGPIEDASLATGDPGLLLASSTAAPDCAWDDFRVTT